MRAPPPYCAEREDSPCFDFLPSDRLCFCHGSGHGSGCSQPFAARTFFCCAAHAGDVDLIPPNPFSTYLR